MKRPRYMMVSRLTRFGSVLLVCNVFFEGNKRQVEFWIKSAYAPSRYKQPAIVPRRD